MTSPLLKRYLDGEHEAVWLELTRLARPTDAQLEEARTVALATMERVRTNALVLAAAYEQIAHLRFDVGFVEGEDQDRVHQRVGDPIAATTVDALLDVSQTVPVALRAFWEIVGHLNFTARLNEEAIPLQTFSPRGLANALAARSHGAGFSEGPTNATSLLSRLDALLPELDEEELEGNEDRFVKDPDVLVVSSFPNGALIVGSRGRVADGPLASMVGDGPLRGEDGEPLTFIGFLRQGFRYAGTLNPLDDSAAWSPELIALLTKNLIPF